MQSINNEIKNNTFDNSDYFIFQLKIEIDI